MIRELISYIALLSTIVLLKVKMQQQIINQEQKNLITFVYPTILSLLLKFDIFILSIYPNSIIFSDTCIHLGIGYW